MVSEVGGYKIARVVQFCGRGCAHTHTHTKTDCIDTETLMGLPLCAIMPDFCPLDILVVSQVFKVHLLTWEQKKVYFKKNCVYI